MKKILLSTLVLASATAQQAQAQSSVTIYGQLDVGVVKVSHQTTSIGRGDNNKLGFKGSEDLGGGLSAVFQLETRFEPDTGTTESAPNRPLFQGESRVGLKGAFGTVLIGRGLTAMQETVRAFSVRNYYSNRGNLVAFEVAGYNGDPLSTGSSQNRVSNALFYSSPLNASGMQVNLSLATLEPLANGTPTTRPSSLSGTYNVGPVSAFVAYEKNAIDTHFWNAGVGREFGDLMLRATYAQQTLNKTSLKTKGYTLSAEYTIGSNVLLAGYGRNKPDNISNSNQVSLGLEHNLSKRTFLYVDAYNRRAPNVPSVHVVDAGIHHAF
jgi:predicted porin